MSIRTKIHHHLKTRRSITRMEALALYGCMDVTTVIRDLKAGSRNYSKLNIITELKHDPNGKVYARYHIAR